MNIKMNIKMYMAIYCVAAGVLCVVMNEPLEPLSLTLLRLERETITKKKDGYSIAHTK